MPGDLFVLTQDIKNIGESAINSLIHQLGRQCKVIYESNPDQCNNCYFDSANQRSSGVYNTTGPRPFTSSKCPVCRGTGFLPGTGVSSDTFQLLIDWQPKSDYIISSLIKIHNLSPESARSTVANLVMVKGFIINMPMMIQAKYVILDYPNAVFENNRFVLFSEPVVQGNIIQNKYFNAFLQRSGN